MLVMLAGCASTQAPTATLPMPDDLGWSTPVVEAVEAPISVRETRPASAAEKVVSYTEGEAVKLDVAIGVPLTLQFEPDEHVVTIVGGDRSVLPADDSENPWTAKIGAPGSKTALVHITVTRPGLSMSLAIPTSQRLYLIDLRSVAKSRVRLVRWNYGPQPMIREAKPPMLPDATVTQRYHTGYRIEPSDPRPVWTPTQTLDDGRKTYMRFPPNLAAMSAPMIRLIGPNGYELVNARMVGSVLVLDHLIERAAELRLGTGKTAEVVRIVRGPAVTIQCPGDAACPIWPDTVARQVGR
jgi:type IV secretion system protein TrbG